MNRPQNLYHISFVGGAFSGKSSCLSYCEKHLADHFPDTDRKVTLFFAKEEATEIIKKNPTIDNTTLHFQFMVLSGQLAQLYKAQVYAEQHPDEAVFLISDRSAIDGMIYLTNEEQRAIGWDYMCNLYDQFFLFDCCLDHFKSFVSSDCKKGNAYRKETSAIDLIHLAEKTKSFYLGASMVDAEKVTVIHSFDSVEAKQIFVHDLLIESIRKAIGEVMV